MAGSRHFPGRVIFDHLPKTAGQAVNRWLVEALGPGCVTPNLNGSHFQLIRRYGGRYSVISGHVKFEDDARLDPRYQYATVLREPMDRTASWIYYLLHNVPEITSTRSLIEGARRFVASAGLDTTEQFLRSITDPYVTHFAAALGGAKEPDQELALEAIRRYDVVGVYEEMPAFLASFAGLLGVRPPAELGRVNVTVGRMGAAPLPPEAMARARELNARDIELHRRVTEWVRGPAAASPWRRFEPPAQALWEPLATGVEYAVTHPDVVIASMALPSGDQVIRGQLFEMDFAIDVAGEGHNLVFGIHIFDEDRRLVFGTNSKLLGQGPTPAGPGRYNVRFCVVAEFAVGVYAAGFAVTDHTPGGVVDLAWHPSLCTFELRSDERAPGPGHSPAPTVVSIAGPA